MMNKNKKLLGVAGFLLAILAFFLILKITIPPAKSEFLSGSHTVKIGKSLNYTAIGDSLTSGVGDSTKEGGFVPLLAHQIEAADNCKVNYQNFGKAGDTSVQIYNRLIKQKKIQTAVKSADIITITVGGNDLMKAFRGKLTNLSSLKVSDFNKPAQAYQKQLVKLFDEIRSLGKADVKIYVLGIYNPFYLSFSDIPEFQELFDKWNKAAEETVNQEKATFVSISNLIEKGSGAETGTANDLLSQYDEFHPNNVGYKIMANAVFSAYEKENK
ncbi:SGNH/GDSL hydrolase family protein [Lactovum odontotermitis]